MVKLAIDVLIGFSVLNRPFRLVRIAGLRRAGAEPVVPLVDIPNGPSRVDIAAGES